jgi:hypothetical protein
MPLAQWRQKKCGLGVPTSCSVRTRSPVGDVERGARPTYHIFRGTEA